MRVSIALIHNRDESRNILVKDTVASIMASAPNDWTFDVSEVSWQPKAGPLTLVVRTRRIIEISKSVFLWETYKRKNGFWSTCTGTVMGILKTFAFVAVEVLHWSDRGLKAFKTIQLTRKHSIAWFKFLESNNDFLICLEDDAFLLDKEGNLFKKLFNQLQSQNRDTFTLLSEGIPELELNAPFLVPTEKPTEIFSPAKPFANTTAAYLVSRSLLDKFCSQVSTNPSRLLINIDFLINRLFGILAKSGDAPTPSCFYFSQPPIANASLSTSLGSSLS
jgi:hypothetical protein